MSKYGAGDDIYARADSDDDWETDGDYENKLSEKEQRKAGTADRLVVQTEQKAQVSADSAGRGERGKKEGRKKRKRKGEKRRERSI